MTIPAHTSGHAIVNGVSLYYEIHGTGEPLVLLHGGLMTIPELAPLLQPLASNRQVIAVELQGHGRSPDTDRPLRMESIPPPSPDPAGIPRYSRACHRLPRQWPST